MDVIEAVRENLVNDIHKHEDLQTVVENFLSQNDAFFDLHGINLSEKGKFTLLNYRQDAEPNQYNRWCRALVLDRTGKVRSLPFARFFNVGQKEAVDIDLSRCHIIEKMDGTLIGAFYDEGELVFHTRRTISSHQPELDLEIVNFNGKSYSLLQVAKKYIEKLNWKEAFGGDHSCWAFELIHDATKVVTEYPEDRWGLYLLNGRDLTTMKDWPPGILHAEANALDAHFPQVWFAKSYDELDRLMATMPPDFEGFVARNWDSLDRVKYKNPTYVERHHMVDRRTYRYLIPLWLKGERAEIEAYFPDTTPLFNDLEDALKVFAEKIRGVVMYWQGRWNVNNWTKKQLAEAVLRDEEKWLHSYIFRLYDKPWDGECVRAWLKAKLPGVRYVEEVLGVTDMPTAEDL